MLCCHPGALQSSKKEKVLKHCSNKKSNVYLTCMCLKSKNKTNSSTNLLSCKLELRFQRSQDCFNWRHVIILLGSMNPPKSSFCCKLGCHRGLLFIINSLNFKILKRSLEKQIIITSHNFLKCQNQERMSTTMRA